MKILVKLIWNYPCACVLKTIVVDLSAQLNKCTIIIACMHYCYSVHVVYSVDS